jgi:hypothetical protein
VADARVAVARFAVARAGAFRVATFRVVAVFARAGRFAVARLAVFLVEVLVEVARFEVVRADAFVFDAAVFVLAGRFIAVARPPDFFEVFDCLAITILRVDPRPITLPSSANCLTFFSARRCFVAAHGVFTAQVVNQRLDFAAPSVEKPGHCIAILSTLRKITA